MQRGWNVLLAALLTLATGVAIQNWQDWRMSQGQVRELEAANQRLESENRSLEQASKTLAAENRELAEQKQKSEEKAVELQTQIRRVIAAAPKPAPTLRVMPEVELDGAWPSVESAAVAGNFRAPRQRQATLSIEQPSTADPVEIPLHVWIGADGTVRNVEAVGLRTKLALLAEAQIQKLSYQPARHKGGPASADMYLRLVIPAGGGE